MQLDRVLRRLPADACAGAARRLAEAPLAAVKRQLALAPPLGDEPSLEAVHRFALAADHRARAAQTDSARALAGLTEALGGRATTRPGAALAVLRAGIAAHGLSHAQPHFRLNASQIHNALRRAIASTASPPTPAQRRAHLAAINALLDRRRSRCAVDFGALAAERASATRLMMTVAQILKHVDGSHPVRFLIAETETGYTLLAALCRSRGAAASPTRSRSRRCSRPPRPWSRAPRILDEALRNPHWRRYLPRIGRLAVQFGYSDSGRYVGQLAATF